MDTIDRVELLCRLEAAEEWLRVATWTAREALINNDTNSEQAWRVIESRNRENVSKLTWALFDTCQDRRFPDYEIADLQLTPEYIEYPRELGHYLEIQSGIEAATLVAAQLELVSGAIH